MNQENNGKHENRLSMIGFFHEDEEYGCFSNWYPAAFDYAGKHYKNSEQFMMCHKVLMFHKYDLADKIMQSDDPSVCKKIASQKFPEFDSDLWEKTCYTIVKRGVKAKFAQNEDILATLLDTKGALLAECSPYDKKWGIGIDIDDENRFDIKKWKGKNLLGRILMEVREELTQELSISSHNTLKYTEACDLDPIKEWKMAAGELKRIPQFYNAIHVYADTLPDHHVRDVFYYDYSLYEWEIAMRTNMGGGLPIIGFYEMKQEVYDTARRLSASDPQSQKQVSFCLKYIPILRMIENDTELKKACSDYSAYSRDKEHESLIRYLESSFLQEAYDSDIVIHNYSKVVESTGLKEDEVSFLSEESLVSLSSEQVLGCIAWHFRRDHFIEGSLISDSIASGCMLKMLEAYVDKQKLETRN